MVSFLFLKNNSSGLILSLLLFESSDNNKILNLIFDLLFSWLEHLICLRIWIFELIFVGFLILTERLLSTSNFGWDGVCLSLNAEIISLSCLSSVVSS